jgi:hypothetical protein
MPEYNDNSKVKREGRPFTSASGTVRIRTLAPLLWVKSLIQQAMTVFFSQVISCNPARGSLVSKPGLLATNSNRQQCEGARVQSPFEPASRQAKRLPPT